MNPLDDKTMKLKTRDFHETVLQTFHSSVFCALPPVKGLDGSIKADQIHQRQVAQGKHHLPAGCLSTSSHHCIVADHIWPDTLSMEQCGTFWHPVLCHSMFMPPGRWIEMQGIFCKKARAKSQALHLEQTLMALL